jgi:hypothetical protein
MKNSQLLIKSELIVISILLLLSLLFILDPFPKRIMKIEPGEQWITFTYNDQDVGGVSTTKDISSDSIFSLQYNVKDNTNNPYCALGIKHADSLGSIEWFEEVVLTARTLGIESARYLFTITNNEPDHAWDPDTGNRYNESYFTATSAFQDIVIPRESFKVPTWWLDQFEVEIRRAMPIFDDIINIAVSTGSRARPLKYGRSRLLAPGCLQWLFIRVFWGYGLLPYVS